jgi:hypothetical protein
MTARSVEDVIPKTRVFSSGSRDLARIAIAAGIKLHKRRILRSVDLARSGLARIQLDLPKGALISLDILLQQSQQRLGLLRA